MQPQDVVVALKVENTISGWLLSGKLVALKRENIHSSIQSLLPWCRILPLKQGISKRKI